MENKEISLPCECQGEILKVSVFMECPEENYINYYTEYLNTYSLWERIKQVFKPKSFFEVILNKENMIKLRDFINDTTQ